MSNSVAAGLVVAVILIAVVAWMQLRGGSRLMTRPVTILLVILAVMALALIAGW